MTGENPSRSKLSPWVHGLLLAAGMGLIVWQFFTFKQFVEVHTAKAQQTSRAAGWAGQPVGTMEQNKPIAEATSGQATVDHIGFIRTALPWSH